ncbi:Putative pyridoxamine 5'-phosphate oxidase [Sodalis praecaptivus]|uniref:Putative pyridoxamine 5'-phosphate oxidase n=1 Tax=Sodalis praecaptivus TaxID=1239307 RepID=W0I057_9GAMM|nr:MSMEG_1061 family FMN-dependent PPOX-type flavoprotein [Sodalis praecaptivus]AHF77828.1 Putative pyridoxamine 5'-phosphate oxidase [Sodalis praecaptivus]
MLLDERYILQDSAQLRDYYAAPHPGVLHKQIDHLDDYARRLIALSPFVVLGTQGPRGFDCSPKGGEPGFIQVENDKTLLLPDRGGNNRLDGLTNLLHHPFAGLLFLIPGWSECFRVNGRAQISVDPALCARFAQNGVPAKSVVVIRVDEAFIHCGRAIGFAGLWESGRQHDPAQLPKALEVFKAHVALHKAAQ